MSVIRPVEQKVVVAPAFFVPWSQTGDQKEPYCCPTLRRAAHRDTQNDKQWAAILADIGGELHGAPSGAPKNPLSDPEKGVMAASRPENGGCHHG